MGASYARGNNNMNISNMFHFTQYIDNRNYEPYEEI